jgi:hypothetical protein
MNAALLLVALTIGQTDPTRVPPPNTVPPPATRPAPRVPASGTADPAPKVDEPAPFTLDVLAAGAKNDAFVDEFLREKKLTLSGTVQGIERFSGDEQAPTRYRLVMTRLGRDDRAVDVEVYCYFAVANRKDLSLLEPDVSKVTVEGNCTKATLQGQTKGLGFLLVLEECKIIPTPVSPQPPARGPGPAIIPNVIDPATVPRTPVPPPPPLPMQP